jgi:hypothetical protein
MDLPPAFILADTWLREKELAGIAAPASYLSLLFMRLAIFVNRLEHCLLYPSSC